MRTSCLTAALCLAFSLIPVQLSAQSASEKDFARWRTDLQSQEERLRRQEWKAVARVSRDLIEEMVDGLLVGEASATMLALAVVQQAVAESGLGHLEEAVWLLHLAQNLDARYRDVTLGSYGPAGAGLERFRLRQPGEAPAAGPKLPAEGSYQPPRVLRQKDPKTPNALAHARIAPDVEVEMVVGPDGQVLEPVLVDEPKYPSLVFAVLESLRGWRFEPARASGVPVPALFRTRIWHAGLEKAAAASFPDRRAAEAFFGSKRRLAELDDRLRSREAQAVQAKIQEIQKLVAELRESERQATLLALGLRTLALAEAGMGRRDEAVWHWQAAQNLQPDLALDPAAYGEAGAFLAQHKLRRRNEAPAGIEAVAVSDLGAGSTPPRKVAGDEPVVPAFLEESRALHWVRLQAVIDSRGLVVEPVVLAGRSKAMQWAALEAVRAWRFEPARREGQPVAVFLDLQIPPRVERPLAEIVPLAGELGSVHALLLQQQWGEARTRAIALLQSVAEEDGAHPERSAAALAFLALADAGSGSPSAACYWHSAQSLAGELYHANLDAYGAAGALLEASNPWKVEGRILRVGESPAGETVMRPEKIGGSVPQYTTRDRRAGVRGTIIIEGVVGEDGRLSQLQLLKGLSPGLDLMTLITLCGWRFKPATLDGRPVQVHYALSTSFDVSH